MIQKSEVRILLNKLCVDLGFCLPPDELQQLENTPPSDVRSFTDAVFVAEGMNPDHASRHLYRQVRDAVSSAFKQSEFRSMDADIYRNETD